MLLPFNKKRKNDKSGKTNYNKYILHLRTYAVLSENKLTLMQSQLQASGEKSLFSRYSALCLKQFKI